jgi:aquaporin PIP
MSTFRAACYMVAQLCGATLGSLIVRSLAPTLFLAAGGGANGVASVEDGNGVSRLSTWTVLGAEMLGTGVLVLTVCAAADVGREKNNKYQAALTPLMIGFAVTVAHLVLIPIDGCSVNPARSFGAALVAGAFPDHYLFWAGPMLGAALAAFVYTNLLVLREKEEAWGEGDEDPLGRLGGGIALLRMRAGAGSGGGTPSFGAAAGAAPVPPSPQFALLPAPALVADEERARTAARSLTLSARLDMAAGTKGQLALGERQHVGAPARALGSSERAGVKEW